MNFTSAIFLTSMLPVFLIIYYLLPGITLKNILLLITSLYFYSTSEPIFIYFIIGSVFVNYMLAKLIFLSDDCRKRKYLLIADIVFNVGMLAIFKYTDFIIATINQFFVVNIPKTNLPLPIGISFFTFQAMSYVFDIYYNKDDLHKSTGSIFDFGLYLTMFPQLVAGPIVRFDDVYKDIYERKFNVEKINHGLRRFIFGLSKKILLANTYAIVADTAFSLDPKDAGSSMLFLGAVCYTLQIYFDFSGYSDMAIGIGQMLGFKFPENFNKPYLATSVTDFWKRWHMTLSSWFRDYVYFPLGGSKYKMNKTILNLFIVWLLTGLWHGAKWTFVAWGLLYFLFISFEKIYKQNHNRSIDKNLPYALVRIYTLFVVMVLWIFFRSDSIKGAFLYIFNMLNITNIGLVNSQAWFYLKQYFGVLLIGILLSTNFFDFCSKLICALLPSKHIKNILASVYCAILLVLCLLYIVKGGFNPFIYFNF